MFFFKRKKSVMLQGYLHDANFGDNLFALLFYRKCLELDFKSVDFVQWKRASYRPLGIGDFCRKELGYTRKKNFLSCLLADAFVLISGGSLWDDASIIGAAKIRYLRFILPAKLYQFMHKPVYVLGVGGGPVDTPWLQKEIVKMLNKAKLVLFRDEETLKIFKEYGVTNKAMFATADTALVVTRDMLDPLEEKSELDAIAAGRKKLLVHIPDGIQACEHLAYIILPGLIEFLKKHSEYLVVISEDNLFNTSQKIKDVIERIKNTFTEAGTDTYSYKYHNCWQMCSLISEMDCIITEKLHVGVLGCALGKSVLSSPVHREKTLNFYKHMGLEERCIPIKLVTPNDVLRQMETFHDKPIIISDELRQKAKRNLDALEKIL